MKEVTLAVDCLVLWKQTATMSTNYDFTAVSRGELPVRTLSSWGNFTVNELKQEKDAKDMR